MRVLDLYCGGGGVAVGIKRAGVDLGIDVEIIGIDIVKQKEYPYRQLQLDLCRVFEKDKLWRWFSSKFDFIWASPPCQAYSRAAQTWVQNRTLPALIPITRAALITSGLPYCIENVQSAPLARDSIRLCGEMFGIGVIRHRLFETNWSIKEPEHQPHKRAVMVPHRKYKQSAYCSVAGHGGDGYSYKLRDWQQAMDIDWIHNKKTLSEAVPPVYSHYIFSQFLKGRR